eukprot:CAMPEP_0202979146 /NCGR_PEP_ID=MMETSP1396-20130829/85379_1 /ASSEMBLY_ACC=CAM_ASM_000872 /TAXON_ID= /ORGANISM="Pseudokeronopsis sp., Strain Brazil" /LENGTH=53 /DNA_ID=CAMNT_0049718443 /DNA_START=970 /DNA_END=1131 /DNA_ORIENTATION=-
MKERNSLFDSKNKASAELEKNQKLIMVKPEQYCSMSKEGVVKLKPSLGGRRGT